MNRYSDLIDSDPVERDPHEHEADSDMRGLEDDNADSDTDTFDEEPTDAPDSNDEAPDATEQPQNEKPKTSSSDQRREETARDDEDTNPFDDADEENDEDEENEYAEVDDRDEEDATVYITPEPLIYRARFYAQETMLLDDYVNPEDEPDPELELEDFVLDLLDADAFYDLTAIATPTDAFVQLEPDDLSDPLAAFRWFDAEDVFVEPYTD